METFGIELGILVDKLNGFEQADEIAAFLNEQQVQGYVGDGDSCVITAWLTRESGRSVSTTDIVSDFTNWSAEGFEQVDYPLEAPVQTFISKFDNGFYPELVIEDEECDCEGCHPEYYDADYDWEG